MQQETQDEDALGHIGLDQFDPVHSAELSRVFFGGGAIFNEGVGFDWHLIRARNSAFRTNLKIRIVAEALSGCDAEIYVNHWGGVDVFRVLPNGIVVDQGIAHRLLLDALMMAYLRLWPNLPTITTRSPSEPRAAPADVTKVWAKISIGFSKLMSL